MQDRLDRFQDRASKRRQIARDVMVELNLKKLTAPDFTASIRDGLPAFMVIDADAVPSIYWQPGEPRLKRQELAERPQRRGGGRRCCALQSRAGPEREGTVMGFTAKQVARAAAQIRSVATSAPARPMAASYPTSRAGTRSRKPTGSSASMAGIGKPWNPAACWPERTAVPTSPSISRGSALPCMPMGRPSFGKAMVPGEGAEPRRARSTTSRTRPPRPTPPSERWPPSVGRSA